MRIALTHNLKRSAVEAEAEFDTPETIDALLELLERLGHAVVPIEVSGPVAMLVELLADAAPDLVFNIAEGSAGRAREAFYPALFEQLGLPFTGSDAAALVLAQDKALAKRLLSAVAGVLTPRARLLGGPLATAADRNRRPDLRGLRCPVIIKPNNEGSSKGITQESVVEEPDRVERAAADALRRYPAGVLVEEYIDGTDVAVAWVEGLSPATGGVLAPATYRYESRGRHRIYELALKRTGRGLVEAVVPALLDPEVIARLVDITRRIVAELGISGYGRADFRVTPAGDIYFLEMNPLPSLAPGPDSELYRAAELIGRSPADVLACIVGAAARPGRRAPAGDRSAGYGRT